MKYVLILVIAGLFTGIIFWWESKVGEVNPIVVQKFAEAIGFAEGFFKQGSLPSRIHNPGDLTLDLIGKSTGKQGMYVVFANDADGWANLRKQIELIYGHKSKYYRPEMSIAEMSKVWTATVSEQGAWARNVAAKLGVSVETRLDQLT